MMRVFFTAMISGLALLLAGCKSAKPPPNPPLAVTVAERVVAQAVTFSEEQNWPAAAQQWAKAAQDYALLNDLPHQAIALHNQAEAELEQNHPEPAHNLFEMAAALNQRLGRDTEWWRDQIGLLQTEAQLTNSTAQIEKRFAELGPRAKNLKSPLVAGLFLNEQGLWHRQHAKWDIAMGNFTESQTNFAQAHYEIGLATVIANRALLAEDTAQAVEAESLWRDALSRYERLAQPLGIANSLAGVGRSLLEQHKNLPEAKDCLTRAIENFKVLKKETERQSAQTSLDKCRKEEAR